MKLKLPNCLLMLVRPNKSVRLNWERFAIWSLVAVSFMALFFTGCVIWAKCHGN